MSSLPSGHGDFYIDVGLEPSKDTGPQSPWKQSMSMAGTLPAPQEGGFDPQEGASSS